MSTFFEQAQREDSSEEEARKGKFFSGGREVLRFDRNPPRQGRLRLKRCFDDSLTKLTVFFRSLPNQSLILSLILEAYISFYFTIPVLSS